MVQGALRLACRAAWDDDRYGRWVRLLPRGGFVWRTRSQQRDTRIPKTGDKLADRNLHWVVATGRTRPRMNLKKPAKESALVDKWHGEGEFFHQFGKNIYFEDLGRFEEDGRIGQAILGISEPKTPGQCLIQIDGQDLEVNRALCTGCSVQMAHLDIQKDCQDCQ